MRVSASLVSPPQPRRRADVLPERVWRHQQLLARRLRRGATPLSQPCASCAPICALFRTRPTLVGEDRPFSASRASSGASLSSDGASPMLPPAPASQPARGRHRRPHALSLVVGAFSTPRPAVGASGECSRCCSAAASSRGAASALSRRSPLALLQHPFPSLAAVRQAPPQSMRQSRRSEGQPRARRRQRGCSPGRTALETSQWRPPLTWPRISRAGHASCCASRAIA